MGYPYWDVPYIGGGLVIALVATLHVLIAQFAVGAGLLIATLETVSARRASSPSAAGIQDFLRRFARLLILISFVAGALTGVGIWFAISLASPRATSILIHHFVWAWAAEWVLFFVEIATGYLYYVGFETLTPPRRRALAWIYATSAWGSLVIINAILGVMLSPGRWLATHNLWDGLLNPTFWPSLVLRTILSLAIAGAATLIIAQTARTPAGEVRHSIARVGVAFVSFLIFVVPVSLWYYRACPGGVRAMALGDALRLTQTYGVLLAAATLAGLYGAAIFFSPRWMPGRLSTLLLLAIPLSATASMELVREAIRKPYLIDGYLYSNGWLQPGASLDEAQALATRGVLALSPWAVPPGRDPASLTPDEVGRAVYRAECAQCHNAGGVNDIARLVRGWSRERLVDTLDRLHELKPFMPPVVGTAGERAALQDYLWRQGERTP